MFSILIGLASIIPGLGLLLLKKVNAALIAFIVFIILAGAAMLAPEGFLSDMLVVFAFVFWISQILYTQEVVKRISLISSNDPTSPKTNYRIIKPPKGLSRAEKVEFSARQTLLSQLQPGEGLKAVLLTMIQKYWIRFLFQQASLGITKDNLVVVEHDLIGQPLQIFRYPLNQVIDAGLKKGGVQVWLVINLRNRKPKKYLVYYFLEGEGKKFAEILSGDTAGAY